MSGLNIPSDFELCRHYGIRWKANKHFREFRCDYLNLSVFDVYGDINDKTETIMAAATVLVVKDGLMKARGPAAFVLPLLYDEMCSELHEASHYN